MSTSISENQFTFNLPNLSYIDISLDEPDSRVETRPARSPGFAQWLAGRAQAFRAWRAANTALNELSSMSDRELMDIGLTRSDFGRMFDETANQDLKARGTRT